MKIALAQLNYHIGNFEANSSKIKNSIKQAKEEGADLVVFAELAICGYPPRDFLHFNEFSNECKKALKSIARECTDIAAVVGSPTFNNDPKGKGLFNSACFLYEGEVKYIKNKTLLPTYDIFDENRYFEPNNSFGCIEYKGKRIALTVCEDLWNIDNESLYTADPLGEITKDKPDLIINIAASPFSANRQEKRKEILRKNARKFKLPIYYVNHIGAQTELIFDGGSLVLNSTGEVIDELNYFSEDFRIYDTETPSGKQGEKTPEKYTQIHDGIVLGIRDYFSKLGFEKAIVGLSGGIDSAVTTALAVKALGQENVKALIMPSQFSSKHSVDDSLELVENLGCEPEIIAIESIYKEFKQMLQPAFLDLPFDVTEENMQARIRAVLLMAQSNKFGNILLNTSNKSELAVGYGTLYGDMCGGLSVIGDVYKTEVYELAEYINNKEEVIPKNILTKPPSAELRPEQKDTDFLPDYEILDKVLKLYLEEELGPDEIVKRGLESNIVSKTLKMVNTTEFKRQQAPPILRVSTKAFGMGRRMPIVGKYLS